ncbi:MAG: hypothetical protein NVSMB48_06480 [Marmoricola sp.]
MQDPGAARYFARRPGVLRFRSEGPSGRDEVLLHLLARQRNHRRHTGLRFSDEHAEAGELQSAESRGVHVVGQHHAVHRLELARALAGVEGRGENRQAARDAATEAEQGAVRELVEQGGARSPHQLLRTVDEGGVGDSVVDEGLDDGGETSRRVLRGGGGRLQCAGQRLEVAHERQGEDLVLAAEVSVDDRAIDARAASDVLDLRLLHATAVEQLARGGQDLLLAGASTCRSRRTRRAVVDHGPTVMQHAVAQAFAQCRINVLGCGAW